MLTKAESEETESERARLQQGWLTRRVWSNPATASMLLWSGHVRKMSNSRYTQSKAGHVHWHRSRVHWRPPIG